MNAAADQPIRVPLEDVRETGPAVLSARHADGSERLLAAGRKLMSPVVVRFFNWRSRLWAQRTKNPYLEEIALAAAPRSNGVWFMNFCYEWGCTTGVGSAPEGGLVMRRTLDWPFHGLGRELVVAHQTGPAGDFYNLTWPGFVGVITGMAPGRFAIAINQAPMRRRGAWPKAVNWLLDRVKVHSGTALPPAHLVRQVFETCPTFEAAVAMLEKTPIALPALISVVGIEKGESCILEHLGDAVRRHDGGQAVANDWLASPGGSGHRDVVRGKNNTQRRNDMLAAFAVSTEGQGVFDWVTPPICNEDTRLAAVLNPSRGDLHLMGYEVDGPATEAFSLSSAT